MYSSVYRTLASISGQASIGERGIGCLSIEECVVRGLSLWYHIMCVNRACTVTVAEDVISCHVMWYIINQSYNYSIFFLLIS